MMIRISEWLILQMMPEKEGMLKQSRCTIDLHFFDDLADADSSAQVCPLSPKTLVLENPDLFFLIGSREACEELMFLEDQLHK